MNKRLINIVSIIVLLNIFLAVMYKANAVSINKEPIKVATSSTNKTKEKNPDDSNSSLSKLIIEGYDMYPEFNKNTTKYYVSIPTDVKSIEIDAESEVDSASVKISGNTSLTKTENTVSVVVTAKDRTARKYTIIVTKQEDNGLKLTDLSIKDVELDTPFSEGRYYYTAKTEIIKNDEIPPFEIKATPNNDEAEVEIIGNSNITEGENLITILLKDGEDYTTYQVNISVSTKTMVTTIQEADDSFVNTLIEYYDMAKEKVINWFEDENRKLATIVAGGVVLFIIILLIIIKIHKKHVAEKKAEKIKRRAK